MRTKASTESSLVRDIPHAQQLKDRMAKQGMDEESKNNSIKQIDRLTPMQPMLVPHDGGAMVFCSTCHRDIVRLILEGRTYCPHCGQKHTELPSFQGPLVIVLPPGGEGSVWYGNY